jgi:acyl-coenzyme A thioesterase PaaI-like protein
MPDGAAQPAAPFAAGSSPGDLLASMPYALALGITLNEVTPQLVRGSLDWSAERCTASGVMHGGAVMSLADTVGAVCAVLNLPLHAGRSFIVVRTDLADDAGRPVGQTTQTQAVLAPRPAG